ncbi:MAG: helix-turn-helix domain-containing protein [Clostridia bacterium]|nr:helix-turn-helix domain-containing protein [Clostridia bacterium]
MNEYMTIKEVAEKWDISIRRINTLCNDGRIPGCVKFGVNWAIPSNAEKPADMRIKSGKYVKNNYNE